MIEELNHWIEQYPAYITTAVFLVSFLESLAVAGILVPGVVILFGLAGLAGSSSTPIMSVCFAAFGGAVAGDISSFFIGRFLSDSLKTVWPLSRYPDLVSQSEKFFRSHGGKSVIIGRFIGPIRPVLPAMAGMLGMPPRRFVLFNVLSALLWAPWYILPGYLVGNAISLEDQLPEHFFTTLFMLLAIILITSSAFVRSQWMLRPSGKLYQQLSVWIDSAPRLKQGLSRLCSYRQNSREYPLASTTLSIVTLAGLGLITLLMAYLPQISELDLWVYTKITSLQYSAADNWLYLIGPVSHPTYLIAILQLFVILMFFQKHSIPAAIHLMGGFFLLLWFSLTQSDGGLAALTTLAFDEFRYPSLSCALVSYTFGVISASIARELPVTKRWPIYTFTSVLLLLISFSYLYSASLWLTDILGGICLGLCLCGLCRLAQSPFDRSQLWQVPWLTALATGTVTITAVNLWIHY